MKLPDPIMMLKHKQQYIHLGRSGSGESYSSDMRDTGGFVIQAGSLTQGLFGLSGRWLCNRRCSSDSSKRQEATLENEVSFSLFLKSSCIFV